MQRDTLVKNFLDQHGWAKAVPERLKEDASFRQYWRVRNGDKTSIVMDAAPPFEEVKKFVRDGAIFRQYGLHTPEILAVDEKNGLLLLEDMGNTSFDQAIGKGHNVAELYKDAVDVLIHLHRQPADAARKLPTLDDARLTYLASWIIEWYIPLIQPQTLSRVIREKFFDLWVEAFATMRRVPQHIAHMDYQFHNLMLLPGKNAVERCGILDFQDAVFGPITCDLVLLLENAREDVPKIVQHNCLEQYLKAFPNLDRDAFEASFAIASALNASRILGLFSRLKVRDRKPQYLQHIPRNLKYLEQSLQHPALSKIKEWFDTHMPTEKRLAIPELKVA
jgi:aminoglycoside/choline kinase family phosphotransferase